MMVQVGTKERNILMPLPPLNDEFTTYSPHPEPSIYQQFLNTLTGAGGVYILQSMNTLNDFHTSISNGVIVPESEFQEALNDPHMIKTLNAMRDAVLGMYEESKATPPRGVFQTIEPIIGALAESATTVSPKNIMNVILIDAQVDGLASRVKNGSATRDDISRHRATQSVGFMGVILENPEEEMLQAICSGEIQIEQGDIKPEYQFLDQAILQGEMIVNQKIANSEIDMKKYLPEGVCS